MVFESTMIYSYLSNLYSIYFRMRCHRALVSQRIGPAIASQSVRYAAKLAVLQQQGIILLGLFHEFW